jgi:hypothetical protein
LKATLRVQSECAAATNDRVIPQPGHGTPVIALKGHSIGIRDSEIHPPSAPSGVKQKDAININADNMKIILFSDLMSSTLSPIN